LAFCTIQQLYEDESLLRHVVLDGYSRFRGVSLVVDGVNFHIALRAGAELDPDGAVGVAGLVRVVTVEAADGRVGAGWAFKLLLGRLHG